MTQGEPSGDSRDWHQSKNKPPKTYLLEVIDKYTGTKFLVDTGSQFSILPPTNKDKKKKKNNSLKLMAANGSCIQTYGFKTCQIDIGLGKVFEWDFLLADVTRPILGSDFLTTYAIIVDLNRGVLYDSQTQAPTKSTTIIPGKDTISVTEILPENQFIADILRDLPQLTNPNLANSRKINTQHFIQTTGQPVHCRPRPIAPDKFDIMKNIIDQDVERGVCQRGQGAYASPAHLVPKGTDDWRLVGDYRRLNDQTIPDRYPVPCLRDFTRKLAGCTKFSKVDLLKAYNQIKMAPCSVEKTALALPFGLYEYLKMPYGLRKASQTFQRFKDEIFRDIPFIFIYIDDLLIASKDEEEHEIHIKIVLEKLAQYGILVNLEKCKFFQDKLEYLGHQITSTGIAPLPEKVEAIRSFPEPESQNQLRRFLGMVNFYHRFIPNCASILAPLNALVIDKKKGSKAQVKMDGEARTAFNLVKEKLANCTELQHPIQSAELSLFVDASETAIGAALHQSTEQGTAPLALFSKKLCPAEQKYSPFGRELLAMYLSVKRFEGLLIGQKACVYTDHKPLVRAIHVSHNKHSPREARHLSYITEICDDIRHIPGKQNTVADCLSRFNQINSVTAVEDLESLIRAHQNQEEMEEGMAGRNGSALDVQTIDGLLCDISTGAPRPFIPKAIRENVVDHYHKLTHAGIRATLGTIKKRYVFPLMAKLVKQRVKTCLICQKAKVNRHTKAPIHPCEFTGSRLENVHIDIAGPLPESQGQRYLLTMVDRFTRWPEAEPMPDITAETVAKTFLATWVSRYGCPVQVSHDRGSQFTGNLWREVMQILGTRDIKTTSYHPQANGLVENFNKNLKLALKVQTCPRNWVENLPLALLAIRAQVKEDLKGSSAELVFGKSVRLPGDFFNPRSSTTEITEKYVSELKGFMNGVAYVKPRLLCKNEGFVHPDLMKTSHVFIRIDRVKPPLTLPYEGPHKVLKRNPKYFTLEVNGRKDTVSIDRLKPAYLPNTPDQRGFSGSRCFS